MYFDYFLDYFYITFDSVCNKMLSVFFFFINTVKCIAHYNMPKFPKLDILIKLI